LRTKTSSENNKSKKIILEDDLSRLHEIGINRCV